MKEEWKEFNYRPKKEDLEAEWGLEWTRCPKTLELKAELDIKGFRVTVTPSFAPNPVSVYLSVGDYRLAWAMARDWHVAILEMRLVAQQRLKILIESLD